MEDKKSILVIGSTGHALADKCVDWGTDFYIGDYDVVIANLTDLGAERIEFFKMNRPNYLEDIRKHITETQQKKGLEVFCILEPLCLGTSIRSGSDEKTRREWNNYAWCPIIPLLEDVAEGKKIDVSSSKLLPDYLKLVKGWSILWEKPLNNTGYVDKKALSTGQEIVTRIDVKPLLKNNIGRFLSVEIDWRVQRESTSNDYVFEKIQYSKGSITFLPKVDDFKKAIDIILSDICEQEEELPPDWVSAISVGDEGKISKAIEEKKSEIETKNSEIRVLEEQKGELDEYKKLLYSSGHTLEEIVEKSFALLGIIVTSPAVKNKEDRLFIKEDASIPIEIRGKNGGLNEKDLNQLTSRFVDKPESEMFGTRGLFVLNHFREIEPEKREAPFNFNIIEKAVPWQACLISTQIIFDLVKGKLEGKEYPDLDKDLFNTVGVFEIKVSTEPATQEPEARQEVSA